MIIVGCDYHPGFQQIAFVDTETGELHESTASGGAERRSPLQKEIVAGSWTGTTGLVSVSAVGQPTSSTLQ